MIQINQSRGRHGRRHGRWLGATLALAAGTAVLAGLALANRHAARRGRSATLPIDRFLQVDGVRLHYTEQGSGSPVVLLHGNGSMAEDFRLAGLTERLAERHRVIAFDRPGFGHSTRPRGRIWTFNAQADLLRQALRQLGAQRAVLVGHSSGTQAALAMALRDPAGTAALVLLSGFFFPRPRLDILLTSLFAMPGLRQGLAFATAHVFGWLVLPAFLRLVFAPSPVPARFDAAFSPAVPLRRGQVQATIADTPLMTLSAALLSRRYPALAMPVVIVAGSDDRIVASSLQSERLHRCIPGSVWRDVAGVGHMVHHNAPDAVLEAIEAAALAGGG
jgi:pimeloyl-ACP methyl ester carboxylesterase